MIRTYRYPLMVNRQAASVLQSWLQSCCQLYNAALEQRRDAYRRQEKTLTYMDQTKDLTDLRSAMPEWAAVPSEVSRSALRYLQRAFDGFFRRLKAGKKPGYPRFHGRHRYDSFSIGRAKVEGDRVFIPKLGAVRFRKYREMSGAIREVTLRFHCGRWYVNISCELGSAPAKTAVSSPIGIDLGLSSFAMLSDGTRIENPRFFRKGEGILAMRQRSLARKSRGSCSRGRARLLVQKAYSHVHNQRLDFARKLAAELYKKHDLVAYEDLNISGLAKSFLAKSVQDAAWGSFVRALVCKAECAGKWAVPVSPHKTSVVCSACKREVPKELSVRVHRCSCGLVMNRDLNAAMNILALGRSASLVNEGSN